MAETETKKGLFKDTGYILIISLLALLFPLVLYFSRALDDNRLTSWMWVFAMVDFSRFFLLLIPGILLAFILSKSSFCFFLSENRSYFFSLPS